MVEWACGRKLAVIEVVRYERLPGHSKHFRVMMFAKRQEHEEVETLGKADLFVQLKFLEGKHFEWCHVGSTHESQWPNLH